MQLILVDGSYYCFHRFFALKRRFGHSSDSDVHVSDHPSFHEEFRRSFSLKLADIIRTTPRLSPFAPARPLVWIAQDCPRTQIWRMQVFPDYKASRKASEEDLTPFFKMAYQDPDALYTQACGAHKILSHPQLEADDCIAITTRWVLDTYPTAKIHIVASDKDYMQLASDRVTITDIFSVPMQDHHKGRPLNAESALFCKIVSGDASDNIPAVFPRCGKATALKYYENPATFIAKLAESATYQENYKRNKQLVDFGEIPADLQSEFIQYNLNT